MTTNVNNCERNYKQTIATIKNFTFWFCFIDWSIISSIAEKLQLNFHKIFCNVGAIRQEMII